MPRKTKITTQRLNYGRIQAGGYVFTKHFLDQWRKRNKDTPSDEKIAIDAVKRLRYSRLIKIKTTGEELRESHGLIFVIRDRTVITVMYTFTKHKLDGTLDLGLDLEEVI